MNGIENRRTLRAITMRGNATTEYVAAQASGYWGVVATVLGIIITVGSVAADSLGGGSPWGILAGSAVALAGIAQKTLASLGYIKARSDIKIAAANALAAGAAGTHDAEGSGAVANQSAPAGLTQGAGLPADSVPASNDTSVDAAKAGAAAGLSIL